MRNFLYENIGRACLLFAGLTEVVGNALIWVTAKVFESLRIGFAHFCMWLLMRVDSKRVQAERDANEQSRVHTELTLMAAAVSIKEGAIELGDWTDEHSEALNMVGVGLIQECNWEPAQVHRYFKPLVESFEGLEYGDQ